MQLETNRQSVAPAQPDGQPSPIDFEMAYQARVAVDRMKFAIKHTEQFGCDSEQMREVGLQLLDAVERLETADRQFQHRTGMASPLSTRPRDWQERCGD